MAYTNNNQLFMNYDPRKHPCKDCTKRNAYCHGVCEEYKEFEQNRPRTPRNMWSARGKLKDVFHKKGRVITKR